MSAPKRVRTAPSDDWDQLQLRLTWPEQQQHELIRPIVLFGLTPAARAEQTGTAARTLARQADRFDAAGLASFFDLEPPTPRLADDLRQVLRELKAEYAGFSLSELATIGAVRLGHHLSHKTVARFLTEAPLPAPTHRRFPPYRQLANGTGRRLAIVRWQGSAGSRSSGRAAPLTG
ncbi:MAG: helix-turn-helix domain-containing protein [Dehalococcoidia bacterium]